MEDLKLLLSHFYNWTSHIKELNDIPFLEKYKLNLDKVIETNQYNNRLTINWGYYSNDLLLLPNVEQLDITYLIEKELVMLLENDLQSILYYACFGNGIKEWRFYSNDISETLSRIKEALSGNLFYSNISINTEIDPDWTDYKCINRRTNSELQLSYTDLARINYI